jgi:hypothetical protein
MGVEHDGARIRTRTRLAELPEGTPDEQREALLASVQRLPNGRAAGPAEMRKLAALGGGATRDRSKAAAKLPAKLGPLPPEALTDAKTFARTERARLARLVGGGWCGSAPSSFITSAALALVASRHAYCVGDFALGSRLAVDSRQHLLAAHELCAREAEARRRNAPSPWGYDPEPEARDTLHAPAPGEDEHDGQGDDEHQGGPEEPPP